MGNIFDALESATFKIVGKTMGYDAVWIPSDGSYQQGYTARVLFIDPSKDVDFKQVKYSSLDFEIEYENGFFPLLKEKVDSRNSVETISLKGSSFTVVKIRTKVDGDTICATLKVPRS